MRLLVLRPEPDASETASRLRALGHVVLIDPMLDIAFAPPPPAIERPAAIMFTSRNAVRALQRWPDAATWNDVTVYAVGVETAALAGAAGFADVRVAGGDAEALVRLIAADFDRRRGTLLYPAARHRAADLEGKLSALGVEVTMIEAYEAVPATRLGDDVRAALERGEVDGALFYSRRTAATFRDAVDAGGLAGKLAGVTLYALSRQVAAPLADIAGAAIDVAPHPDNESLFALLTPARSARRTGDSRV